VRPKSCRANKKSHPKGWLYHSRERKAPLNYLWCVVVPWLVVVLSSEATAATAASATPIDTMAATDRPALGAAATAGAGAGAGASAGVVWANAWPEIRLMIAIAERTFFILYSFSLKICHRQI
jgi:hypothetical protein